MSSLEDIPLFQTLEMDSPELAHRIRSLADDVGPLLARIYSVFPAYTEHGRSHSEQVASTLGWLLSVEMPRPLTSREIFYLLAAALLHDVGMLAAVGAADNPHLQEEIRDSHHIRSAQYVRDHEAWLGLDAPEATVIAEICRAHRQVSIARSVSDVSGPGDCSIRMQLLCAVLRIADELHLTADRAPRIVLEAIQPGGASLTHWRTHLSVLAVGPADDGEGVIRISAAAETAESEKALRDMVEAIQRELAEVEEILGGHGLPWKRVILDLQRREVVKREIVLCLAADGKHQADSLADDLGESIAVVQDCVDDLMSQHHIEREDDSTLLRLAVTRSTFEYWLHRFLNTMEEIEFVLTPYSAKCVEGFAFEDFRTRFGAVYDGQERRHRVVALQSSPTALNLLSFVSEFQVDPSILPRRLMLDAAILLGLITDLFRFPQIAQIDGVQDAAQSVQAALSQETPGLMRLLSALGADLGRSARDVARDILSAPGRSEADAEEKVRLSLKVTHAAIEVRRGLTLPHLLKASLRSGEPLEIVRDRVELSTDDPRLAELVASPSHRLILVPRRGKAPPASGMMFCRLELNSERRWISLRADMGRSADYGKYPLAVRVVMSPDRNSASFSPSVYATHVDVQQAIAINQMYAWLASGDFDKLTVQPDEWDESGREAPGPVMEALGSDFRDSQFQPFLDDAQKGILMDLVVLQTKLGERIPFPLDLSEHQAEAIQALAVAADALGMEETRQRLRAIAAESDTELTSVRVSTYFHDGGIETDEFLGPFGRLRLRLETEDEETSRLVAEALREGKTGVFITRGFGLGAAGLAQAIHDGLSTREQITLMPEEHAVAEHPRSMCQITIHPIERKMWYTEQLIHYQIREFTAVDRLLTQAHQLLEDDNPSGAVNLLTDGLGKFPKEPWVPGLLGWAHYKDGDLDAACQRSAEAIEWRPDVWLMSMGYVYYNLGLFDLLRHDVGDALSRYQEAVSLEKGPPLDEAIEDLAAELSADCPERTYALAFLYEHKGEHARARKLYAECLSSASPRPDLHELSQAALDRLR